MRRWRRSCATGPTRGGGRAHPTAAYASFVRGIERIDGSCGKAYILAQSQVFGGSPDFYKTYLQRLREATPLRLQSVAQQWLSDGVFVLNVMPTPEYSVATSSVDRSKMPATGKAPDLKLPPLERATLSNGLKVVLAERHNAPLVGMTLIVDAGYAADSLATPGTAKLATGHDPTRARRRATRCRLRRARNRWVRRSARAPRSTRRSSQLNALTAQLPESLELFTRCAAQPHLPGSRLRAAEGAVLAGIQQEKAQPRGIASRLFPKLIYGEGPCVLESAVRERLGRKRRRADARVICARSISAGFGRTTRRC